MASAWEKEPQPKDGLTGPLYFGNGNGNNKSFLRRIPQEQPDFMGKLRRLIEPVHQFCNAMLGIFTGISPLRQQGAGLAAAQALSQKTRTVKIQQRSFFLKAQRKNADAFLRQPPVQASHFAVQFVFS